MPAGRSECERAAWFACRDEAPVGPPVDAVHLSPRQRETLALLARGKSAKEVAAALDLSTHTVNKCIKALHKTLGVRCRGELLARALRETGLSNAA